MCASEVWLLSTQYREVVLLGWVLGCRRLCLGAWLRKAATGSNIAISCLLKRSKR